MDSILSESLKGLGVLVMILLKDRAPTMTVRFLRLALCLSVALGVLLFAGYVVHLFMKWFTWL